MVAVTICTRRWRCKNKSPISLSTILSSPSCEYVWSLNSSVRHPRCTFSSHLMLSLIIFLLCSFSQRNKSSAVFLLSDRPLYKHVYVAACWFLMRKCTREHIGQLHPHPQRVRIIYSIHFGLTEPWNVFVCNWRIGGVTQILPRFSPPTARLMVIIIGCECRKQGVLKLTEIVLRRVWLINAAGSSQSLGHICI